eukprot:755962-Hanusia_phi.AAC.7
MERDVRGPPRNDVTNLLEESCLSNNIAGIPGLKQWARHVTQSDRDMIKVEPSDRGSEFPGATISY